MSILRLQRRLHTISPVDSSDSVPSKTVTMHSMDLFEWLRALAQDADPAKTGFQASWLYIFWNIAFPVSFGLAVSLLFSLIRKLSGADAPKEKS
jgi:hypothetical protein